MTRESELLRLRAALRAGNDGVFVVVSDEDSVESVLGHESIPLDHLLATHDIGNRLMAVPGSGPIEISAPKGVTDQLLRSLNHSRDQLRIGRAVLLVFDPSDAAG